MPFLMVGLEDKEHYLLLTNLEPHGVTAPCFLRCAPFPSLPAVLLQLLPSSADSYTFIKAQLSHDTTIFSSQPLEQASKAKSSACTLSGHLHAQQWQEPPVPEDRARPGHGRLAHAQQMPSGVGKPWGKE